MMFPDEKTLLIGTGELGVWIARYEPVETDNSALSVRLETRSERPRKSVPFKVLAFHKLDNGRVLAMTDTGGVIVNWEHDHKGLVALPVINSRQLGARQPSRDWSGAQFWKGGLRNDGLFVWHPEAEEVYLLEMPTGDYIRAILSDQSDLLWIGTATEGLVNVVLRPGPFQVYAFDESSGTAGINHMYGMAEDTIGRVWVSSAAGLALLDINQGLWTHASGAIQQSLNAPEAFTLHMSRKNPRHLWVGYFQKQLSRLDWTTKENTPFVFSPLSPYSFGGWSIRSILEDQTGKVWIGDTRKLFRFDPETHLFESLNVPSGTTGVPENQVSWALHEDQQGDIWVGTNTAGLVQFHQGESVIHQYEHDPNDSTTLSENSIKCISEDSKGNLWIGTLSGGLNYFDRKAGQFFRFTVKDGLSDNMIHGILRQNDQTWWISTSNGLCKLELPVDFPANRAVRVQPFFEADGLPDSEFNLNSFLRTRAGYMLFGGDKGLVAFHPDSMNLQKYGDVPQLTRLWGNNQEIIPGMEIGGQV
ncbi:MAG: two-component regulator propeller domain-containing protein, partial [Bacteroidota bacterium]